MRREDDDPTVTTNEFHFLYRITLEDDAMQNRPDGQTQLLLREAYDALLAKEEEILRERSRFENEIESLRQTLMDSQQLGKCDGDDDFGVAEKRNVAPSDLESQLSRALAEKDELSLEWEQQRLQLISERDEAVARVESKLLEEVAAKDLDASELESRLNRALTETEELSLEWEQQRLQLISEKDEAVARVELKFRDEVVEKERAMAEADDLLKQLDTLRNDVVEIQKKKDQELAVVETMRDELKDQVAIKDAKLEHVESELARSRVCIQGVTEAAMKQVVNNEKMEKEIRMRDRALKKLTIEYEAVKAKLRKYRELHPSGSITQACNDSQQSNVSGASALNEDSQLEVELEKAKKRERELMEELDKMKLLQQRQPLERQELPTISPPPPPSARSAEITAHMELEITSLRSQLSVCRSSAMHEGAKQALNRANDAYSKAARDYTESVSDILEVLRQRLIDLVDFLQHLLSLESDGLLDFSAMSFSMREALHRSIEEGRRLSQRLTVARESSFFEDVNETQRSEAADKDDISENFVIPQFKLPEVQLGSLECKDSRDLCSDLEIAKATIKALKEEKLHLASQLEVIRDELDTNVASVTKELKKIVEENKVLREEAKCAERMCQQKQEQYCDCQERIKELERLLEEAKALYNTAQETIRQDKERREKMIKAAKVELEKTQKVLRIKPMNRMPAVAEEKEN